MAKALFPSGLILVTPGAVAALRQAGGDGYLSLAADLVARHLTGDWGEVDAEDAAANVYALAHGLRLLSAYTLPEGAGRLWVITEADRSATTLLQPDEY